jgi:hypothetical protein
MTTQALNILPAGEKKLRRAGIIDLVLLYWEINKKTVCITADGWG